jgi:hypothetical protein
MMAVTSDDLGPPIPSSSLPALPPDDDDDSSSLCGCVAAELEVESERPGRVPRTSSFPPLSFSSADFDFPILLILLRLLRLESVLLSLFRFSLKPHRDQVSEPCSRVRMRKRNAEA